MDANDLTKPTALTSALAASGLSTKQQRTVIFFAASGAAVVSCSVAAYFLWRSYKRREAFLYGSPSNGSPGAKLQKSQFIINELRKVSEEMTALRQDVNSVKMLVKQLRRDVAELRGPDKNGHVCAQPVASNEFRPIESGTFVNLDGYVEDDEDDDLEFRSAKSDDGLPRSKSEVRFSTSLRATSPSSSDFYMARENAASPSSISASDSDFRRVRPVASKQELSADAFTEIDAQLDNMNDNSLKREALHRLEELYSQFPDNADVIWRLGRALYFESEAVRAEGNDVKRRELAYRAKDLCFEGMNRLADPPAVVFRWCALTLGNLQDFESISNKIKQGYEFRSLIEKAIELDPNDALSHYLLGRWFFGCYQLTWYERKIASTLFATPPTATIDEALGEFLRCSELVTGAGNPEWKENCLYIARCYIDKRDYAEATRWLRTGRDLPDTDEESRIAGQEIAKLLAQYSNGV